MTIAVGPPVVPAAPDVEPDEPDDTAVVDPEPDPDVVAEPEAVVVSEEESEADPDVDVDPVTVAEPDIEPDSDVEPRLVADTLPALSPAVPVEVDPEPPGITSVDAEHPSPTTTQTTTHAARVTFPG